MSIIVNVNPGHSVLDSACQLPRSMLALPIAAFTHILDFCRPIILPLSLQYLSNLPINIYLHSIKTLLHSLQI